MGRPTKNPPFELPDGRKTPVTLKLRGNVYRVQFKDPEGKFTEVTTGRSDPATAWSEAAKIVLTAYNPTAKPDPRKATWEQVLTELPSFEFRDGTARPRALEAYTSRLNVFRELLKADNKPTSGPNDVTVDVAKRFKHLYQTGTFTKSKKEGAKQYKRSITTVRTTLRLLSCLWNHLITAGLATANPWQHVTRPKPPTLVPTAPTEPDFDHFFKWIDAKGWELLSVFFRVKALSACRTEDLCQARSSQFDPKTGTLTIDAAHDKTNQEGKFPLPEDLAKRLNAIKGKTYLWERYATESQTYRPGRRNAKEFTPSLMYWFIDDVCPQYRREFPDRPHITPHDLRRRAITLTVIATGGSVDAAAKALRIHPDTARKHYLDASKAFDTDALLKKMAGVLAPK
jgi:integrase